MVESEDGIEDTDMIKEFVVMVTMATTPGGYWTQEQKAGPFATIDECATAAISIIEENASDIASTKERKREERWIADVWCDVKE